MASSVNKKELILRLHSLATNQGIKVNKKEAGLLLDSVFDIVKSEIHVNGAFSYPNFGKFTTRFVILFILCIL